MHEWDDKWDSTVIDYFNLPDEGKLFNINADENAVPDGDTVFFLTISNAQLNSAGVIEINGASIPVIPYQQLQTRWLTEHNGTPGEAFPMYKLNPPTAEEAAAGVRHLTSLKIVFDSFAILKGELIGTNTGCVRGNDPGQFGEYRNGALTLQAADATGFATALPMMRIEDVYVAANTAFDATHQYIRIAPDRDTGADEYEEGIHWESTSLLALGW